VRLFPTLLALTLLSSVIAAQEVSVARGHGGAIAAAHPLAADAGLAMLEAGGNAADAAAAAAFTLAVVEADGSGLGGGGMALVRMASTEESVAINYRSTAPQAASYQVLDYFIRDDWMHTGLAVATPGMVAGVLEMHSLYGRLPRAQVLAPAIEAAREGYEVGETFCLIISDVYQHLIENEACAELFLIDFFPPEPGQVLRNADLARVLEAIAEEGSEAFYTGPIAEQLAAGVQEAGGLLTAADLASYEPVIGPPVRDTYRGYTLECSPPPFAGFATLEALSILEQFDLEGLEYPSAPAIQLFAEAIWTASRDYRRDLGDPRYVLVDADAYLTDARAIEAANEIRTGNRLLHVESLEETRYNPGSTTHLSVIDGEGNAISLTQTLGGFFGCAVVAPGTGVTLNSQMVNFSSRPGLVNSLSPGKRMRSSMSPTIVTQDGELRFVIGTPGHYRITTTMPEMLLFLLEFEMPLEEAMVQPRFALRYTTLTEDRHTDLDLEGGINPEIATTLRALGFRPNPLGALHYHFGGVHAVAVDPETGEMTAVADPRRDGVARAF
jgi:gamma-glutamyltranspeptidase / glutathione hydrolase